MMDQRTLEATGAPLAVCINDCRLDCGQSASELAPVCFQVGCAFAEMRWGSRVIATAGVPRLAIERLQDERAESR
jgi:hypothetical protein